MDKTLRIVLPAGLIAFAALMAYAMTLQLRIWHVMAWSGSGNPRALGSLVQRAGG